MYISKTDSITNETQLKKEIIRLSKIDSSNIICAEVTFGTTRFYKFKNKSSIPVDSPQSRCMLNAFSCVGYKNGKPVQPTASWMKKNNRIPRR